MSNHVIVIEIWKDASGKFKSTTTPTSVPVKFADVAYWSVEPRKPKKDNELPADAEVELRFVNGSIVGISAPRFKKNRGLFVHAVKKGRYPYKVWYVSPNEEYEMEDPELVMDGETMIVKGRKNAIKRAVAKILEKTSKKKR